MSSAISSIRGAVYIFSNNGTLWSQSARLTSSDGVVGDEFGDAVALSADGSTLAVGARSVTVAGKATQGATYIFTRNGTTWTQVQKFTPADGAAGDQFGYSTSISANGSIIAVGSPLADVGGVADQGAVYVLVKSGATWTQATKLAAADATANAQFGYSTVVSGSGLMVAGGAPFTTVGANGQQGAVYAFFQGSLTKLTAADGAANDGFGSSLATSDDGSFLIAGASFADVGGRVDQGAAYVFLRSWTTWTQSAKLTSAAGAAGDRFGYAVAIAANGYKAAVSAPFESVGANLRQGAVYVFDRSAGAAWNQAARLTASDGVANDLLGQAVAVTPTTVIAGAPTVTLDQANPLQGAAYFYAQPIPLAVTANPINQFATVGVPVTFTAESAGPGNRTVQWQVSTNGTTWTNIAGETLPWLTLTPTLADSGERYRAVFSDSSGTATTTAGLLTVSKANTLLKVSTSVNPRGIGDPLAITVDVASAVAGLGTPNGGTVFLNIGAVNLTTVLVNGHAVFSNIAALALGTYTVTATYDGTNDPTFGTSQGTASQVVVRATSVLTGVVPTQPATVGDAVTIAAVLTPPAGVTDLVGGVVILDNGNPIAFPQLVTSNGTTLATITTTGFAAGTHRFQFVFLGNPQIYAASTGVYTLQVNAAGFTGAAPTSHTAPGGSASPGVGSTSTGATTQDLGFNLLGGPLTVTVGVPVTLTSAANNVVARSVQWQASFDGVSWVNIVDANSLWYTFTPTLAQSGLQLRTVFSDLVGSYEATTPTILTVAKAATALKVSTSANPRGIGDPLAITVEASSAVAGLGTPNGGTVFINVGSVNFSGTLVNGLAVFGGIPALGVGTYTVTATYDGTNDPTFGTSQATASQVVVRATAVLTGVVPTQPATVGDAITISAVLTVPPGVTDLVGGVVILDNGIPVAFPQLFNSNGTILATITSTGFAVGTHRFQFVFLGNPQIFAASTGVYTLQVNSPAGLASASTSTAGATTSTFATASATTAASRTASPDALAIVGAFDTVATGKKSRASSALGFWGRGMR
nr:FG-GAP repeat protein [Paludisphaera mucosa]